MHYYPFGHVKVAWNGVHTFTGKVAVVLFNALTWTMILTSLYSVVDPSSEGTNCVTDQLFPKNDVNKDSDDYAILVVNSLIRVLNWFGVGFFLVVEWNQIHVINVALLAVIMCGAWISNSSLGRVALAMDPNRINEECWNSVLAYNAAFAAVAVLVLCLVLAEYFLTRSCTTTNRHGSREENRSLL